ncbi:MAG: alpha/beta hydrolase [Spirillospora sp.]
MRTWTGLLALTTVVVLAAGTGCDAIAGPDPTSSPSAPRVERKATNPPPGLPASFTTGQRLTWAACPAPSEAQGGGKAPGNAWECATMKAPLDYRRPTRATIKVALIRKKATGPDRKRMGSLLFNFGGPGQPGVVGLPKFARDYARLGERYDLVSFDPRGVGATIPVKCGEGRAYGGGDGCEKYSGRVLPYVGTSQTARDMDLMRYLLGDQKLHYLGVSYGTRIGGVYAHLFPKNVGRLVLEAPIDPTLNHLESDLGQARAAQFAFDRFARQCATTYTDCPLGRDPEQANQRVIDLLSKLEKKPAPTGGDEKLDDSLAAHAIADFLGLGEQRWRPLAEALTAVMKRGDGSELFTGGDGSVPQSRPRGKAPGETNAPAFASITCADSNVRPGFTGLEEMIKRVEAASPVFGGTWSKTVYLCYEWPFKGERANPDVSADGAAPVLVVANTGDPTTPYEGAERMADELGEGVGVLLTVRDEGHGSYPHNHCAAKAVNTYLLDGKLPATSCGK